MLHREEIDSLFPADLRVGLDRPPGRSPGPPLVAAALGEDDVRRIGAILP